MKLYEYLIKYYGFKTEAQCKDQCEMYMVTVNGIACENHEILLWEGEFVGVIRKVSYIDGAKGG
jgi:hypothetical protein